MAVPLQEAVLNTGFAGLLLSFMLLVYYTYQVRNAVAASTLSENMDRYYSLLQALSIGSMFAFTAVFTFLWYTRIVPVAHDWVRIALDALQFVFLILVMVTGRKLVKTMIQIQKRHGL